MLSPEGRYPKDPGHHWKINDFPDIDALASTLPYCDIVVTDKAAAANAIRGGLGERLNTVILSRVADLPAWL